MTYRVSGGSVPDCSVLHTTDAAIGHRVKAGKTPMTTGVQLGNLEVSMPARKSREVEQKNDRARTVVRRPRAQSADREVCPKCGRLTARLIGRSETYPVLYLRCDDCSHTSVAPA